MKNTNKASIRADWDSFRAEWMLYVIWAKCQNNDFAEKLKSLPPNAIIIENNAKGFALASDAREFSYSVTLSGNTLNIEVIEPTGFIYISDDITITINIFFNEDYGTSSGDFSNFGFNISTTSGNVDIGASTNNNQTISPRAITAETTSGSIIFRSCTQIDTIQSLSLTTDNGGIQTIGNNVTYNGQSPECTPAKTVAFARNVNHIMLEDIGYRCKMTTIGYSTIKTVLAIDYIDLDYGFIGGYYSIGLSGPTYGGGAGYMLIRLPKNAYPLSPELKAPTRNSIVTSHARSILEEQTPQVPAYMGSSDNTNVQIFPINK